uniref:Transcriptional regulator n=2 Tax=Rhizobium TaxID=379 RepID=A0A179BVM3_RHILE|nr:transcriptional regulator [Rhizobium leguminosarum]
MVPLKLIAPPRGSRRLDLPGFGLLCNSLYYGAIIMLNSEKSQVSLRLPTSLVSEFDRIAAILERDRTWVMQKALSQYLAIEGAEILADAQGLDELDRGDSVDLEDVLEKARAIVDAAENRRRMRVG